MRKASGFGAVLLAFLICSSVPALCQSADKDADKRPANEQADACPPTTPGCDGSTAAVDFIRRFKLGMTYKEVQAALPKAAEQDILSYITGEDLFLLNVDLPGAGDWSASFRFDTADAGIRQPEHLVELSLSASLSSRNQPFEA